MGRNVDAKLKVVKSGLSCASAVGSDGCIVVMVVVRSCRR